MYRETFVDFIQYFWIDTDWGLLWLSVLLTLTIMSSKAMSRQVILPKVRSRLRGALIKSTPIYSESRTPVKGIKVRPSRQGEARYGAVRVRFVKSNPKFFPNPRQHTSQFLSSTYFQILISDLLFSPVYETIYISAF